MSALRPASAATAVILLLRGALPRCRGLRCSGVQLAQPPTASLALQIRSILLYHLAPGAPGTPGELVAAVTIPTALRGYDLTASLLAWDSTIQILRRLGLALPQRAPGGVHPLVCKAVTAAPGAAELSIWPAPRPADGVGRRSSSRASGHARTPLRLLSLPLGALCSSRLTAATALIL